LGDAANGRLRPGAVTQPDVPGDSNAAHLRRSR
jgi:hypothetical protein